MTLSYRLLTIISDAPVPSIYLSIFKKYFYTILLVFHYMIFIHKPSWNPSECFVRLFSLLLSGLITVLFFHICLMFYMFVWRAYFFLCLKSGFSSSKCRGDVSREESSNFMRARRFSRYQGASLIQGENISPSILDFQKLPLKQDIVCKNWFENVLIVIHLTYVLIYINMLVVIAWNCFLSFMTNFNFLIWFDLKSWYWTKFVISVSTCIMWLKLSWCVCYFYIHEEIFYSFWNVILDCIYM